MLENLQFAMHRISHGFQSKIELKTFMGDPQSVRFLSHWSDDLLDTIAAMQVIAALADGVPA